MHLTFENNWQLIKEILTLLVTCDINITPSDRYWIRSGVISIFVISNIIFRPYIMKIIVLYILYSWVGITTDVILFITYMEDHLIVNEDSSIKKSNTVSWEGGGWVTSILHGFPGFAYEMVKHEGTKSVGMIGHCLHILSGDQLPSHFHTSSIQFLQHLVHFTDER